MPDRGVQRSKERGCTGIGGGEKGKKGYASGQLESLMIIEKERRGKKGSKGSKHGGEFAGQRAAAKCLQEKSREAGRRKPSRKITRKERRAPTLKVGGKGTTNHCKFHCAFSGKCPQQRGAEQVTGFGSGGRK